MADFRSETGRLMLLGRLRNDPYSGSNGTRKPYLGLSQINRSIVSMTRSVGDKLEMSVGTGVVARRASLSSVSCPLDGQSVSRSGQS